MTINNEKYIALTSNKKYFVFNKNIFDCICYIIWFRRWCAYIIFLNIIVNEIKTPKPMNPFFLLEQQTKKSFQPNYPTTTPQQYQPYNQPNNPNDPFSQLNQNIGQLFNQPSNIQPTYPSQHQTPYGQPSYASSYGQNYGQPYGQPPPAYGNNNQPYGQQVTYGQKPQMGYGQQNYQQPQQKYNPNQWQSPQVNNNQQRPGNSLTYSITKKMDVGNQPYHGSIKPEQVTNMLKNTTKNISAQQIQNKPQKQLYPQLQQYKAPKKASNDGEYLGWAQQKTTTEKNNDKLGQTKYVMQVGKQNKMENTFNKNMGNALFKWISQDQINKNIVTQQPKKHLLKQKSPYAQWDQAPINIPGGGFRMPEQNRGSNKSIWDQINLRHISFQLNPIFNRPFQMPKFPSPFIRYKIIPYMDEKMVLDVTGSNDRINGYKKNNMIIYNYHGGPNQLFYIKQAYPEVYYLVNVSRGYVVRIPNPDAKSDAPAYANPRTQNFTDNAELWKLVPFQNSYLIESVGKPGYVLDLYHEKTSNGTHVILWKKLSKDNQKWVIYPA